MLIRAESSITLNFIRTNFHSAAIPITTFSLPKGLSKKILLSINKIQYKILFHLNEPFQLISSKEKI